MSDVFAALAAPFPADAISWRVGSTNINKQSNEPPAGQDARGMALAYLDARDVMGRFDAIVGPGCWQNRFPHAGDKTVCEIGLLIDGQWIWKSDGAGDTDVEGEKGALSSALKRAAVLWGVGRYLYGLDSPWVKLTRKGRTWLIDPAEMGKLRALLVREGAQGSQEPLRSQLEASVAAIPEKPSTGRMSSAEAKRQKAEEPIKAQIAKANLAELVEWDVHFEAWTAHLPLAWLDPIRDMIEHRRADLLAGAPKGEAEMDAAFRETVGSPSPRPVAGANGRADRVTA